MRNTLFRAAVIAAVLGLATCGAAVPPVRGKGGPAWVELTSEHFTVWTDGDLERVRELVGEMEYLRQLVVGVMFPSAPASRRMLVVALRDDDELKAFASTGSPRPFAMSAHPHLEPVIPIITDQRGGCRIARLARHRKPRRRARQGRAARVADPRPRSR